MNLPPIGPILLYQTMENNGKYMVWFSEWISPKKIVMKLSCPNERRSICPFFESPTGKCRYISQPCFFGEPLSFAMLVWSQVFLKKHLECLVAIWRIQKKGSKKWITTIHLLFSSHEDHLASTKHRVAKWVQTIRIIYLIHLAGTGEFPFSENSSSSANQSVRTTKRSLKNHELFQKTPIQKTCLGK